MPPRVKVKVRAEKKAAAIAIARAVATANRERVAVEAAERARVVHECMYPGCEKAWSCPDEEKCPWVILNKHERGTPFSAGAIYMPGDPVAAKLTPNHGALCSRCLMDPELVKVYCS